MRPDEYERIAHLARTHFWYRATRDLLHRVITHFREQDPEEFLILDAGCGPGTNACVLSSHGRVLGVDVSPHAVTLARGQYDALKRACVTNLPFRDGVFDLVVCVDVLYHEEVGEPHHAFREFARVLKPRGLLIVREPAHAFLARSHDRVVRTRRRFNSFWMRGLAREANLVPQWVSYAGLVSFALILLRKMADVCGGRNGESDVRPLPRLINEALAFVLRLENRALHLADLPVGSSVLLVAKKP